jgi:hypothetical protein
MFIAALFVIVKTWNQPRCSLIGKTLSQTVVHPFHRTLLNNKKEENTDRQNLDKPPGFYFLRKIISKVTNYMILFMLCF